MFKALTTTGIACGMVTLTLVFGNKTLLAENNPASSKAVKMLLSKDFDEQKQGQEQILRERSFLIAQLMAIISEPENHIRRHASIEKAMSILGELRAPEGIKVLVAHIGFPHVAHPEVGELANFGVEGGMFGKPIERLLPAIPALVKIGEPCVGEVIRKLSTADSVLEIKACTEVLKKLNQRPTVCARLERTIEGAAPRKRAQLRKALKILGEESASRQQSGSMPQK